MIAVSVAIFFARSLIIPINKLTSAGKKIADGNLDVEIRQINTKDEIEALGETITLLVGALKFLKKKKK